MYAGKDPITGKQTYLRGETRRHSRDAEADAERLLAHVEAGRLPDRHATVAVLLERWADVVVHELTTAETTAGYVRRTLKPALGDMPLRKLQHRVDILDRLYTQLRRCNSLCDGRSFVGHKAGWTIERGRFGSVTVRDPRFDELDECSDCLGSGHCPITGEPESCLTCNGTGVVRDALVGERSG